MEDTAVVGLAETIRGIRQELKIAMEEGRESGLKFEAGPVEVELSVEARLERGGEGKIRIWVVDAGAGAKKADGNLHRIKVILNPVDNRGNPAQITSSASREDW
jgi:hypothetical protein